MHTLPTGYLEGSPSGTVSGLEVWYVNTFRRNNYVSRRNCVEYSIASERSRHPMTTLPRSPAAAVASSSGNTVGPAMWAAVFGRYGTTTGIKAGYDLRVGFAGRGLRSVIGLWNPSISIDGPTVRAA